MKQDVVLHLPAWASDKVGDGKVLDNDDERMGLVLELAAENIKYESGPFAAAVFDPVGNVVAIGVNRVVPDMAPIAHAEIMAIAGAGQNIGRWDFGSAGDYTLVSSTEPCAMCLGAVPWSGVRRLVVGARDVDARAAGFDEGNKPADWIEHLDSIGIEVVRDVRRDEAAQILLDYRSSGAPIYNGTTSSASAP